MRFPDSPQARWSRLLARVISALLLPLAGAGSVHAGPLTQTLWVFPGSTPNPVTDDSARQSLVANAAASGVAILYISVYSSSPNAAGRYMNDETKISNFISSAHDSGMQVFAAYGAPDWPTFGCGGFPLQRMGEVAGYNGSHPGAAFDGVILDIEPPEPQSASDFQALLGQYDCIRAALPNDVALAVAIRFFWDAAVEYPVGSGTTKPVYAHVIDTPLDHVVLMGYRDSAGPADCTTDGIICLDQDEIAYATSAGKLEFVLAGLETIDSAIAGITNKETFFQEGELVMNTEAAKVIEHFGRSSGFGGFSIHNYQSSYLSGATLWPVTNPSFPTNELAITAIQRLSPGAMRLTGVGVPNHWHTLQTSNGPSASSFSPYVSVRADANGVWLYDDGAIAGIPLRYYRLTLP